MRAWRLGHRSAPCEFVPRHRCSWSNRFDDPKRRYRSLYAAAERLTCLREVLADLRPNRKAIEDFSAVFGAPEAAGPAIAGVVSTEWRKAYALAEAELVTDGGALARIEDPSMRRRLQRRHAALLKEHGLVKLDLDALRSRNRIITQAVSRSLHEDGHAGVEFRSRLDGKRCFALFEGRSRLRALGRAVPMTENDPDLVRVCGEFTLVLRPA